jgi:hypothetical protein
VAACIPRIKATKRVAVSALMAWFAWALPALVDPHRALAGYRSIPARDDGGRREENALAVGQPCDAQAITEIVPYSARRLYVTATSVLERCERGPQQNDEEKTAYSGG